MRKYLNVILFCALLLLMFPFFGFPELWETILIFVIGFVVAYATLLIRHHLGDMSPSPDDESSFKQYVHDLQKRLHVSGNSRSNSKGHSSYHSEVLPKTEVETKNRRVSSINVPEPEYGD
jgi:hypothetical protein